MPQDPGQYTAPSSSLTQDLKDKLVTYQALIQKEISGAQQRTLEIHNTTREAYERQDELITELLDVLDQGEEIVS